MRFDNVRLLTKNYENTFTFYAQTMGLQVDWGTILGNFASFSAKEGAAHAAFSIFRKELMPEELSLHKGDARSTDQALLVFRVENVDAKYEELKVKGCAMLAPPKDMADWGIRVAYLRDTDGTLLELMSELPKEKWSDHLRSQF